MRSPKNSRQLIRKLYRIDKIIVKISKTIGDFAPSHARSAQLSLQAIRRIKNNPARYNAALGKKGN